MSRQNELKVAGVTLWRGPNPRNWYTNMGPNNVLIEFKPTLGKRSGVPFEWKAFKPHGKGLHGGREQIARTVRLKACVEKVTALYWGKPEDESHEHGEGCGFLKPSWCSSSRKGECDCGLEKRLAKEKVKFYD